MAKTERETAVDILTRVTSGAAYNNLSLKAALGRGGLDARQRAFVTELVNGALRNLIYLDYCIGAVSSIPVKKMRPLILNTLRVAAYQILFLDRAPVSAACDEAVKLVKARGLVRLSGFVNGVLRAVARGGIELPEDEEGALAVKYSCPGWLAGHFIAELGFDAAEGMLAACASPPAVTAAVNTLRATAGGLCAALEAEGMSASPSPFFDDMIRISHSVDLAKSAAFGGGLFHVMDESSALCVRVLDPRPGGRLLDVCAAPGGKALYAAYRMHGGGEIIARDIHPHKLGLIEKSAARAGAVSISARLGDAREHSPALDGWADCLLIDAPCSGLGLIRKKPDIKYNKTREDIAALAGIQRGILSCCWRYVKPGGTLVYSTCTVSKAENQDNMRWFAGNFPFEPQDISALLPPGLECGTAKDGYIQILPGERDMDGFFIARFKRV